MKIRELSAQLKKDAEKSGQAVMRLLLPESAFDIQLQYNPHENKNTLVLTVQQKNVQDISTLTQSKGFFLSVNEKVQKEKKLAEVRLSDTGGKYEDIFMHMGEDIIKCIRNCSSENEMISKFFSRIAAWQRFLSRHDDSILSRHAQRGLYGELWFLREVLLSVHTPLDAVKSWSGPTGAAQDFQLPDIAIEVKTSSTKQHQKLIIASEQQLDTSGLSWLFIQHISLAEKLGTGETLPDIVHNLEEYLSSNPKALELFESKILEAGYLEAHEQHYASWGYSVRAESVYSVVKGFPRIIEDDLPNGVGDVRYSVNVSECQHYKVKAEKLRAVLKGKG